MKVHVWVASHIYAVQRHYWFLECLHSLAEQEVDEIYVSYSVEPFVENIVDTNYSEMFKTIKFLKKENRLYQFEHIEELYDQIDNTYDDNYKSSLYIMFCDDDDLYAVDRVSTLKQYLNTDTNILHDEYKQIDEMGNENDLQTLCGLAGFTMTHDFGNYVVKFSIIGEFLKEFINESEEYIGMRDLQFIRFVENLGCKKVHMKLYHKRYCKNIHMMLKSWDKKRDFDFAIDATKLGLDKKLC